MYHEQMKEQPRQRWVWRFPMGLSVGSLQAAAREHGLPLLLYAVLSLGISWPLLPGFTESLIGVGSDPRHNLWLLWHTQQALLGQQPLFGAPDLYYPYGASLLTHGLGPIMGIFALPFWPWGPEAAHNGAVLVALVLTGYCMYLLARGLGLARDSALFAGATLLLSPMCLAGLLGHMTKVFLGLLPLALLALHYTLNEERSRWWALAVALALLGALLHSGYQFVFAALSVGVWLLVALVLARGARRWFVFWRGALVGLGTLVLVVPMLVAIVLASRHPELPARTFLSSAVYQPDLLHFALPSPISWLWGEHTQQIYATYETGFGIEHMVMLSWVGSFLAVVGVLKLPRQARPWLLLALLCVLFGLGPSLHAFGYEAFTPYELPIILPYAFLSLLPGLDFVRVPGRFMMVGFIGFGMAASFGLAWLVQRWPRWRQPIVLGAFGLLLLETWPQPWTQDPLPPVPQFYEQIADDNEHYGVFDLPITSHPTQSMISFSSYYQYYQTIHGKGIAGGYLSRAYVSHPLFPHLMSLSVSPVQEVFRINGQPTNAYADADALLAQYGYRYLVWHKHLPQNPFNTLDYVAALFPDQEPIIDDHLVRVYELRPPDDAASQGLMIKPVQNWHGGSTQVWWARSPATLTVHSPTAQPAVLRMQIASAYQPEGGQGIGQSGVLHVIQADNSNQTIAFDTGQISAAPLELRPGNQTITVALDAGNFRPSEYGLPDGRRLSFALNMVDLLTLDEVDLPPDLLLNGEPQRAAAGELVALFGSGWHTHEPDLGMRWAGSPAEILTYSPQPQSAHIVLQPASTYHPAGVDGTIFAALNDAEPQPYTLNPMEPVVIPVTLQTGWNTLRLERAAGTFRPIEVLPNTVDRRSLAFEVLGVNIITEQ
jgi:hypothetical protein